MNVTPVDGRRLAVVMARYAKCLQECERQMGWVGRFGGRTYERILLGDRHDRYTVHVPRCEWAR